jgi:two-component system, chemotaxis family, chemotaxis protein CheY
MTTTAARDAASVGVTMIDRRVLLVDDAEDVRRFMRVLLESSGWQVDEAEDATAGLAAFDAAPHDVVILDQVMPGMTGLEAAAVLREREYKGPIVLFSAFLDASMTAELERLDVRPVSKVDHTVVLRVLEVYAEELERS